MSANDLPYIDISVFLVGWRFLEMGENNVSIKTNKRTYNEFKVECHTKNVYTIDRSYKY